MSVPGALGAVVYCLDERRTAAFYAGLGALVLVESSDDAVTYAGPHGRLSFVRVPPHVAAAYPLDDPVQRRTENPVKLVLPVASLAAARAAAPGLGGSVDPDDRAWDWDDGRHVDAVDPEGNVVGLLEPAQDRS
jgi:hypothetical protein